MEPEDAGVMHNDALWNPSVVKLQQVWKQELKYQEPGLADHVSLSHFMVSSLHAFFPFLLLCPATLQLMGPPTVGCPTIVW